MLDKAILKYVSHLMDEYFEIVNRLMGFDVKVTKKERNTMDWIIYKVKLIERVQIMKYAKKTDNSRQALSVEEIILLRKV